MVRPTNAVMSSNIALSIFQAPHMPLPNHQLSMTVLMTPNMANFSGNVHGGTILKLLE